MRVIYFIQRLQLLVVVKLIKGSDYRTELPVDL